MPEAMVCPSSAPSSASLQQNSGSDCGRLNQNLSGNSCLTSLGIVQQSGAKEHLEQPFPQQLLLHQLPMQPAVQNLLQSDQLSAQQLQLQIEQSQHLQQLHQNQQLSHLGQQLTFGQQFLMGQQLQQALQVQQGQQLLQLPLQHIQLLQQQQQQQQGQQFLHNQQSQVQQLLQQQPGSEQQLVQQQIEQQGPQSFLQHQGQALLQHHGQPILQQATGQHQRFLSVQHPLSQPGQQPLLQQSQLVQPLQQQLLQQAGQPTLISPLQPAEQQQQLYSAVQSPNQQLLQEQLLQSQPGQQSFHVGQLQQQQQQQSQQQLLQTQQLNNLHHQIVFQAIQPQSSATGSGLTGRSISLVPSGSLVGLLGTVPTSTYNRHLVSSVCTSATAALTTQVSKSNPASGSRAPLSQPLAQRPSTVQFVQHRQNTPLFIGQFGLVPNGAIMPPGIVPLGRSQVSGSMNVQAINGQPQVLTSPTSVQLTVPHIGNTGNLNQQALQVALAQLQQQQQQQSPGANVRASEQSVYIQTGISIDDGNGVVGTVNLPKSSTPSGSVHPLGLSIPLPIQMSIGAAGPGQTVPSWSAATTGAVRSFSPLQLDTGQSKVTAASGCFDFAQLLTLESIPHGPSCAEAAGRNRAATLGPDSRPNVIEFQGQMVTGPLNGGNRTGINNRQDDSTQEDVPVPSTASGDRRLAGRVTEDRDPIIASSSPPEKQTAKVMPQILTHVIEGFVIQEGPEPFPVQRSHFMSEYLDSTDETTDSSCEGQSGGEGDNRWKTGASRVASREVKDVSQKQTRMTKEALDPCTFCAKRYLLPAFDKTGKFCSQSCAKRSAATSRWTMYHVNKRNETNSPNKAPGRGRSPNVNGRGWIRAPKSRNTISAQLQKRSQMATSAISSIQASTCIPITVAPNPGFTQVASTHAPRLAFGNRAAAADHETVLSFQQHATPAQVLASPRQGGTEAVLQHPPATSRDSLVKDLDPTRKHPSEWDVQDVYTFVRNLPGCGIYADEFRRQEIDGQALLLLKEDHLMSTLDLKLGPALKICQQIAALKNAFSS